MAPEEAVTVDMDEWEGEQLHWSTDPSSLKDKRSAWAGVLRSSSLTDSRDRREASDEPNPSTAKNVKGQRSGRRVKSMSLSSLSDLAAAQERAPDEGARELWRSPLISLMQGEADEGGSTEEGQQLGPAERTEAPCTVYVSRRKKHAKQELRERQLH